MSTVTSDQQMSEHLQQAIADGELIVAEESHTATLRTAWPQSCEQPLEEISGVAVALPGRMVSLKDELEMLGYKVKVENTQPELSNEGQQEGEEGKRPMNTTKPCPWCSEVADVTGAAGQPAFCTYCGHRVDVEREQCDCRQCAEKARLLRIREHEHQAHKEIDHWTN